VLFAPFDDALSSSSDPSLTSAPSAMAGVNQKMRVGSNVRVFCPESGTNVMMCSVIKLDRGAGACVLD
jgi:hypothetical protein